MENNSARQFAILNLVCDFAGYAMEMYSDGLKRYPSVVLPSIPAIAKFASEVTVESTIASVDPYDVARILSDVAVEMLPNGVLLKFTNVAWVD